MKTSFESLETVISLSAITPTEMESMAIIERDATSGLQVLYNGDTQSQWFLENHIQNTWPDGTLVLSFSLRLRFLNGVGVYRVCSVETL